MGVADGIARLALVETDETLERLSSALGNGVLSSRSTVGAIQDALSIPSRRAISVREVLTAAADEIALATQIDVARRTASLVQDEQGDVEVAWTHPQPSMIALRTTGAVTREIIDAARGSLVLVGYSVTVDGTRTSLAAQTISRIAMAARRGVRIVLVLHRNPANRDALLSAWPDDQEQPTIYTWPERDADEMASLHAKVLVADSNDALVSSANLTYHGFHSNLEFGVRVRGRAAARLEDVIHELVRLNELIPWPA